MHPPNQFDLLAERRFAPFFWTQFLGAGNDNVYKNALVIFVAFHAATLTSLDTNALVNLAGAVFIAPFVLFSATAGQLADKFEKSRLIRWIKLFEIAIMAIGLAGFWRRDLTLLFTALALLGVHSTLFGPVKYAILPQQLKPEELIGGNGLVEMGHSPPSSLARSSAGWSCRRGAGRCWPARSRWQSPSPATGELLYPSAPSRGSRSAQLEPVLETWKNLRSRTAPCRLAVDARISLFLVLRGSFSGPAAGSARHARRQRARRHCRSRCSRSASARCSASDSPTSRRAGPSVWLDRAHHFRHRPVAREPQHARRASRGAQVFFASAALARRRPRADRPSAGSSSCRSTRSSRRSPPSYRSRIIAATTSERDLPRGPALCHRASGGASDPQLFLVTALMNAAVALYIFGLVPEF
jgi:hypothetical protein